MQGVADPDRIWSAEQAAAASADFAELHAAHGGLLWVAFDPQQARCGLFFWQGGAARELTPPGYSVRSRVYEYGGGACCATAQGAAFVNETDQQIYLLTSIDGGAHDLGGPASPHALTQRPQCRYGELSFVPAWQALLAVEESHEAEAVLHRLVRIGLDGSRQVLVEGADFYAGAVASQDGRQLAWIEWDRPNLPWVATRLCQREEGGAVSVLAGGQADQALQQPRFDEEGRLWVLSDRAGWWQPLCIYKPGLGGHSLGGPASPYDHGAAPWQLGGCSYLPLADSEMLLTRFEEGSGVLVGCAVRTNVLGVEVDDAYGLGGPASPYEGVVGERRLAENFTRFRALAADAGHYYCIAASPSRLPAVLAIARGDGAVRILAGGESPLNETHLSLPQPLDCAVGEGERCHGFFYAPVEGGEKPPLLVFLHGGPTSACYPVFDPRIAFWTLRGYAVLDLNYRGSSGYGRAYRLRLAGQWGALEVEDIRAAVAKLAGEGAIDPARVFVRGASAGGYSALCALISGGFAGGASLYGVSDPLALRRVTHKFEADYLDWLIGDPQRDAARYQARTPLLHAEKISVPVIFFQGGLDAVVLPAQTETMVAALRDRGVPVEYRLYADERHGFRQAAHLADALKAELAFYQRVLQG
ncbi:alpha/beta hydrolase family protein [Pseudomonas sp.]|uniref:alpha/beta hydrolase family protein n=1 Tax=Pseudomonas sp. TaxID=306 RepID=UPI002C8985E4|nr:prolyl oligopeptidase family serine peptidase [Pseudomonas sp.]HUE93571.1 prolyl oligopeptidase family serine peptidase [Pseudomonas sp.]